MADEQAYRDTDDDVDHGTADVDTIVGRHASRLREARLDKGGER